MHHFVYIIYSTSADKFYRGYSTDPQKRILQHNNGESRYTKHFLPWELVFVQQLDSKKEALIRERKLKKYSKSQIQNLIDSPLNQL